MISASKTTFSHFNLKILRPKVTKNIMNLRKKFCEFRPCAPIKFYTFWNTVDYLYDKSMPHSNLSGLGWYVPEELNVFEAVEGRDVTVANVLFVVVVIVDCTVGILVISGLLVVVVVSIWKFTAISLLVFGCRFWFNSN